MVHNLDEQGRLKLRVWQAACCCVVFAPHTNLLPLIDSVFHMLKVNMFFLSCSNVYSISMHPLVLVNPGLHCIRLQL